MKMYEICELARELMNSYGLPDWKIQIIHANSKFGHCRYSTKTIGLSANTLPFCTPEAVRDTITHEMAHAIVGCKHGHDYVWQRKHIELGGNGQRLGKADNYEGGKDTQNKLLAAKAKYIGTCPNGHVHYAFRLPKREHSCGACSRRFDRNYLVTYKLNH